MPHRPPHGCAHPGCPELVRDGARCPDHEVQHLRAQRAEADSLRPSSARRGYGHGWRRIRLAHLRREPLCVVCRDEGRTVPATDVDHILPLRRGGTHDATNLQSLCRPHHAAKTAREDGGFGRHHGRTPR